MSTDSNGKPLRFALCASIYLLGGTWVLGCDDDSAGMTQDDAAMPAVLPDLAPLPDLAVRPADLHAAPVPKPDLALTGPPTGTVGKSGGTVDRLLFGFTGDTRPVNCQDTANYPSTIIKNIYSQMNKAGVQFALTTGDHMYVCNGSQTDTDAQMKLYMTATQNLAGKPVFLGMGNHECSETETCTVSGYQNANFRSFLNALQPISPTPYYKIDIDTAKGLVRLVMIADNGYDADQATWLESTLADADKKATYTIIVRHHPIFTSDSLNPNFAVIWGVIQKHKYTLFLTGHSHEFRHETYYDPEARTFVMGLGGAPFDGSGSYYGYGLVEQNADGTLTVTIYDQSTGKATQTYPITPQ